MSNHPFQRYHWQQGPPPPYFPYDDVINQHMVEQHFIQNMRSFGGPHFQWNNFRNRRGQGCFYRGRHHRSRRPQDHDEYVCFICKDQLQNSEDQGIHLCDGGPEYEKKEEVVSYTVEKENIDDRLGKISTH